MTVRVVGHSLAASLRYRESVLSVVSALNVAHTLARAIEIILTRPWYQISRLDLVTTRDWEQISQWNACLPPKIDSCVHDLVLEHAKESPESPAICSWDGDLNYAKLDRMTCLLAHRFVLAGVGPEVLVPICFRKSMYAIISMIAIHRAGGAFIPLDPFHPRDRVRTIIAKAEARIIVTSPDLSHLLEGLATTIEVSPSFFEPELFESDRFSETASLATRARPSNSAFVLFTSGSTGKPKGIVQEHTSVSSNSVAHGRAMAVSSESRVLQYAAYTFDVSMMDIFTTLIYGGCVCIPSEEDRLSNLVPTMNQMRVNWVLFTPSVASLLSPSDVPLLRTLVLGGEAVTRENVGRWAGHVQLFNCYGPAECAASAIGELRSGDSPSNIGRAFGSGICWLTDPDDHDRLVPIGATGELVVEGPTLARGYLNDLDKTKAAFIKSPTWLHGSRPGRPRRLYKTGDLLRYNSDGSFGFVGRKDFQLKMRGQRVEIGEIEHHLSTCPSLALSLVVGPKTGPYAKGLVAVVQLRQTLQRLGIVGKLRLLSPEELDRAQFTSSQLVESLQSKLPGYMIPNHWLVVEYLPFSASGKIDRKLIDHWVTTVDRTTQMVSPGSDSACGELPGNELTAREVSREVAVLLARSDDKLLAAFQNRDFALASVGLDSIQAMSLSMFIRRQYGVKLPIRTIINPTATIRTIAECIEELQQPESEKAMSMKADPMVEFWQYQQQALAAIRAIQQPRRSILMTGATGFLGSHILSKLLSRDNVERVILHIRAKTVQHAVRRLTSAAVAAGWWSDVYLCRIEIWLGDLASPRLGLAEQQWLRLTGQAPLDQRVTDVIHNGAAVHWNADFATLKPANLNSTFELLKCAAESSSIGGFVYVSGGQQLRFGEDDDQEIASEVSQSNGYAQTKFCSELLVKEFARCSVGSSCQVSVVKPGYIVGNRYQGIANERDYLWRLVASCIDVEAYNAADVDSWLFISEVGRVSAAVFDCLDRTPDGRVQEPLIVKVLDGMTVREFWAVLQDELGYDIKPLSEERWMPLLQDDIETKGPVHRLWPLMEILEAGKGRLGAPRETLNKYRTSKEAIASTVRENIEYLGNAGFLAKPKSLPSSTSTSQEVQDAEMLLVKGF